MDERARIGDRLGHPREAVEGRLEVTRPRGGDGAPELLRPRLARPVRHVLGPEVEHGRVVERPGDGVAGPHDDRAERRRLARAGGRRLARGQEKRAVRVLGANPALPHGQARLDGVDLDQELRPLHRAVDERRRDPERARPPAPEVDGAGQELDPRGGALDRRGEGDRGVLIEAEHRAVAEDEGGASQRPEPHGVTGTVRRLRPDGEPLGLAGAPGLDPALGGHRAGDPVGAFGILGDGGSRRQDERRDADCEARPRPVTPSSRYAPSIRTTPARVEPADVAGREPRGGSHRGVDSGRVMIPPRVESDAIEPRGGAQPPPEPAEDPGHHSTRSRDRAIVAAAVPGRSAPTVDTTRRRRGAPYDAAGHGRGERLDPLGGDGMLVEPDGPRILRRVAEPLREQPDERDAAGRLDLVQIGHGEGVRRALLLPEVRVPLRFHRRGRGLPRRADALRDPSADTRDEARRLRGGAARRLDPLLRLLPLLGPRLARVLVAELEVGRARARGPPGASRGRAS